MRSRILFHALALVLASSAAEATVPGFGTYRYDGVGNITAVGDDAYSYDAFGRLETATVNGHLQHFVYDRYGNIRSITTDNDPAGVVRPGVDRTTNWANLTHDPETGLPNNMITQHDYAGNVETTPNAAFHYDALNVVTASTVDGVSRLHVYSATDERIASMKVVGASLSAEWTVRDAAGRVLRRFSSDAAGTWRWAEDYIYGGPQLLAAEVPTAEKVRHFHLDHLGTPRLTTGNGGAEVGRHTFYPFGKELTVTPDGEPKKFTGHERDAESLDYMHARYYQPLAGRFLSVDPTWESADLAKPQSWNRYAYVMNNPMNRTDPTGRCGEDPNFVGPRLQCAESATKPQQQAAQAGGRTPARGQQPGSTTEFPAEDGGKTVRTYGPDGRAVTDVDHGHDHGAGDPHVHDWKWDDKRPRQPGRPPNPGEIPEPSQSTSVGPRKPDAETIMTTTILVVVGAAVLIMTRGTMSLRPTTNGMMIVPRTAPPGTNPGNSSDCPPTSPYCT